MSRAKKKTHPNELRPDARRCRRETRGKSARRPRDARFQAARAQVSIASTSSSRGTFSASGPRSLQASLMK